MQNIKDRVQPQPNVKWTEEDEDARNHLLAFLNGFSYSETAKHEMWDWLKQLRAKPYWKPSDEQIAWCNIAKDCVGDTGREYLKSLYNDLKKLKE